MTAPDPSLVPAVFSGCRRSHARPCRGVALVLALTVIVLATIIVVAFASVSQFERASSRSTFEQARAQSFAGLAVDEVVSKLRDNIPTDGQWAVGPGKLYCTKTPGGNAPVTVDLSSGNAANAATGSIALNRPSLSDPTSYRIIPQNADYPTPDPMVVNWINVLQDGTRSTDGDYATKLNLTSNPIVGRYAYWTDIETGKVNLNTAGYAATGPSQNYYQYDTQYYQSQPNRVDLSQLDTGSPITPKQSLDTYLYNSGAQAAAGSTTRYNPLYFPGTSPGSRYNSIEEWVRTPLRTSTASITSNQVNANRFYLTTSSRAPELTPWGLNKVWWSDYVPGNLTSTNTGDRINSPAYVPVTGTVSGHPTAPDPRYNLTTAPDNRYYVYPWVASNWNNWSVPAQTSVSDAPTHPFQNFSSFSGQAFPLPAAQTDESFNAFFMNLYSQLARADWPGMPATSFVTKYGQAACENIVTNIMFMADSLIGSPDGFPAKCLNNSRAWYANNASTNALKRDSGGAYGLYLWKSPVPQTPATNVRYLWGQGPWPYVNEVAATFKPDINGYALPTTNPPTVYIGTSPSTKTNRNPGFVNSIANLNPSGKVDYTIGNIDIMPQVEIAWPPGITQDIAKSDTGSNFIIKGLACGVTEIVVQGKGTVHGKSVTYNWTGDSYGAGDTNYTWRYDDDFSDSTNPTTSTASGYGMFLPSTGLNLPTGNTVAYTETTQGIHIYIGPFDKGAPVDVIISFQIASHCLNSWGNACLEVIPTMPAMPKPDSSSPAPVDKRARFTFTYHTDAMNFNDPYPTQSYEAIDPRVYQDMSDWVQLTNTATVGGDTLGSQNSIYVPNPALGVPVNPNDPSLDASKFAWPEGKFVYNHSNQTGPNMLKGTNYNNNNPWQSATSITGMPGLGWMSLVSTANYTAGAASQAWKTLKFTPATASGDLPDWLLMDLFAVVYDQSYCSQTSGKINLNGRVDPFTSLYRTKPLQALVGSGATSDANVTLTNPVSIAQNIAKKTLANNAASFNSAPLYLYPSEICQVAGVADGDPASIKQFDREALIRDLGGLTTTQSSDFQVHVIAQSVKQITNTGNPVKDLKVVAECRGLAALERTPDLGADGIPGTADDFYGPDQQPGGGDDLKLATTVPGGTTSTLAYNANDPMLIGGAGRPPFHFRITTFKILTQ